MEPRTILIKPNYLPALPTSDKAMRRFRLVAVLAVLPPPVVCALVFIPSDLGPLKTTLGIAVPGLLALFVLRLLLKSHARWVAIMAGELPVVSAIDVGDGHVLLPSGASSPRSGLPLHAGDTVSVVVERAKDLKKGKKLLGFVSWRFSNGDMAPLVVFTHFDPDPALLRDVERRLRGLGVSVEITHRPFAETPIG